MQPEELVQRLTLNDLYPLKSVLFIFDKTHRTEITGSRRDRVANKFGLWRVYFQGSVGFVRHQVNVAALLLDAVNAGLLRKPAMSEWPGLVRDHMKGGRADQLYDDLGSRASCYERAVQTSLLLPTYPDYPIADYLTVDDLAQKEGVSRETVYSRSTLRLKSDREIQIARRDGLPIYRAVPFADLHLFLPL